MRAKNIKFYIIYFFILLSYIIGMGVLLQRIGMYVRRDFNFHIFYLAEIIVMFVFGFLIGLEQLYKQITKSGKWKIDGARLLLLGLPCFMLIIWIQGAYLLSMIFTINISLPLPPYPLNIILYSKFSLYAITTLTGYILTTSFYKE